MEWSIVVFLIALTTASLAWAGKTDREKGEQFIVGVTGGVACFDSDVTR